LLLRQFFKHSTGKVDHLPLKQKKFFSASGLPIKRFYTLEDFEPNQTDTKLGEPGRFPFARGIYRDMYRARLWTMREYTGFGSAEATNRRFKFLIKQGQTGLSVAFDLPTQLGIDSDNPRAEGEVGRVGVPVSSVEDMQILFQGIRLNHVSTSMTINATAPIMLAMYSLVGSSQGSSMSMLRGTTQNDVLKEYIARNTYIYPPAASLRLAVDIIEFCAKKMRRWYPISVSGYHIREAGANVIQELAYAFANAEAYVEACLGRGLAPDDFGQRLSFFFACHNDFFEEIAKFRAARRIWAHIMRDKFHTKKPESMMLRFHTQTSGETLTAQQPYNNVVRVAVQAIAAVLGGTQSLHTNSLDEALSLPTEDSVKLALRTQQIIAHESGVVSTVDPLAGSYYLENLTDRIEEEVLKELDRIARMGGSVKAIESGYIQARIRESAYRQQLDIESGKRKIVGVNTFVDSAQPRIQIHKISPALVRKQVKRVKALRKRRDGSEVNKRLAKLRTTIESDQNLIPFIISAARSKATTGELSDVLRSVYGEYHPRTIT
jgi:methylmalonyl-CoA mutase N-terminal domain/subunit